MTGTGVMIKGFFFDLDGTIVDTHQANFEAYRRSLEDFGVQLEFEQFKKSLGHQAQVFLRWFAPGLSDEDYLHIAETKARYYKDFVHLSVLNRQLIKFIDDLAEDHTIGLVTTAKRQNAEAVLSHHKLDTLFDIIITAEDVRRSKPSPEAYLLALKIADLESSEALAFEDSEPGMAAAEAAGISVVHIRKFI
jgi:beta-phosphoglucomutase